MALREANWKSFLSEESEVPSDVFFLVHEEDGGSARIGAHRLLLAGVSPVFKRMFFGPMKETKEVMEVEDTSAKAVRAMIDYIYGPYDEVAIEEAMEDTSTLFELYALGDMYDILNLKTEIMDSLDELEVTMETLVDTATVANNYKWLHVDLSTELMMRCLNFYLELEDKDKESISRGDINLNIFDELMKFGISTLQLTGELRDFQNRFTQVYNRMGHPSLL